MQKLKSIRLIRKRLSMSLEFVGVDEFCNLDGKFREEDDEDFVVAGLVRWLFVDVDRRLISFNNNLTSPSNLIEAGE